MTIQANQQHLQALDFINDGLLIADISGRIVYTTLSMNGLLGRDPGELPDLHSLSGLIQLDHGLTFEAVLESLKREGAWTGEARCRAPSGASRLLDMKATQVNDARGHPLAYVFVARDATRGRSLVKQVMQSQQMELVETLSAGIAHEFKNLLTVIMAYASLLRDQMPNTELQADVARIQQAAHTANELTARLLAVTRHTASVMEEVDVNDVIGDIAALQKKTLPRHIALHVPKHRPLPKVHLDRAILDRALLNLCLNAREAMPEGGTLTIELDQVRLEPHDIRACSERRAGTYLVFSVTDTGPGIQPEIKEHIFEPFFTTRNAATGMGLTVVQHVVRAMGGWVTVYSEPGLGACFRLYIPTIETLAVPVAEAVDEGPGPSGTERLLVVDDDPLALSIAQRILQRAGYTVRAAAGGEEAIEYFKPHAHEIDLVLLDVVMPYVNGEDVYREIHRLKPGIPVLLVSGFTPKTAERLIRIAGATFLTKPFTQRTLTQAVRDALDQRKP